MASNHPAPTSTSRTAGSRPPRLEGPGGLATAGMVAGADGVMNRDAIREMNRDLVKRLSMNHGPSAIADPLGWTFDRVENVLLKFRS